MNTFDIATSRPSTTVHAAPGGKSTFSLAHDSGADGMTPRELAAARKVGIARALRPPRSAPGAHAHALTVAALMLARSCVRSWSARPSPTGSIAR